MLRPPAVADLFYPADSRTLRAAVNGYLKAVRPAEHSAPKALIVPHAGYMYSGPVAASAYAQAAPLRGTVTRVVLLGPAHRTPFSGLAASSAEAFQTPLGPVPLDPAAAEALKDLPQVKCLDRAHAPEHSLEVQLPFLQVVLGSFSLVPLLVHDAAPDEVWAVLERLWGGPETLVVISSDLSHYLDYQSARALDAQTAAAIEALKPEEIGESQACGRLAIQGLLLGAIQSGLQGRTLDLRNSGDTAGPRDQVVGYGAFAFTATNGIEKS